MIRCTVCLHEKRHQIEIALVYGMAANAIARRFGLRKDAVLRHAKNHLTPQQRAAILAGQKLTEIDLEALQRSEAEGILAGLVAQRARVQQYIDMALEVRDPRAGILGEKVITSNYELVAKLLGQLVTHHEIKSTSILISADYLQMRRAILSALRPFPDAAKAVSDALAKIETAAAEEIIEKRPLLTAETLPC